MLTIRDWRLLAAGAAAIAAAGAGAPASAQPAGGGGQTVGPWTIDAGLGVASIQFSRFQWNDVFDANSVIVGRAIDDRSRSGGIVPEIGLAWAVPGGLLGFGAEIYGRFAYYGANVESNSFTEPPTGGFPFIIYYGTDPTGINQFPIALGAATLTNTLTRSIRSYDTTAGLRLRIMRGAWTIMPAAELGYQRLDQDDHASSQTQGPSAFSASLDQSTETDYLRIGLALGAEYRFSPGVAWFGLLTASADHGWTSFSATGRYDPPLQSFGIRVNNQDDSRWSGRVGFRSGLAFWITPQFGLNVSANVTYVGAVAAIANPTSLDGPTSGFTARPQIVYDSQVNYGGAVGATFRF